MSTKGFTLTCKSCGAKTELHQSHSNDYRDCDFMVHSNFDIQVEGSSAQGDANIWCKCGNKVRGYAHKEEA